ncbi:TetR/AcrR family transcriptional regulator [Klebsiella oxytoca]|uniref:TetR/AcrR family transcriptional regulator n=1 Tax=Klebsiella oxytoca TaxID=571 RepID=UPI0035715ED1
MKSYPDSPNEHSSEELLDIYLKRSLIRDPQQKRSRESLERMLAATETLLQREGTTNFTLNDVSQVAKVSIGSIYCRFENKDELLRSVSVTIMSRIKSQQYELISKALSSSSGMSQFIDGLIDAISDTLRENAVVLRALMFNVNVDPVITSIGQRAYFETVELVHESMLKYKSDVRIENAEEAMHFTFRIIYSVISRYLGLGEMLKGDDANSLQDWQKLKKHLAHMCKAYLLYLSPET